MNYQSVFEIISVEIVVIITINAYSIYSNLFKRKERK
jgi:hypothetical protein